MLVATTGAQRASRDPNRANVNSRGGPRRLALGAILTASILAAIGATPAAAATTSPQSRSTGLVGSTTATTSAPIVSQWYSVEMYYLSLVNCTRTGGWVLNDGTCRGYGSGSYSAYVAPLRLSPGISDRVSRPYARLLAVNGVCSHFLDRDPGYRLRRGGFLSWAWGENIGCGDGYASARLAVLDSHLRFQAEKSSNGGHWQSIKAAKYHFIGIGIWRYAGRTRLVTDFYG